MSPGAVSSMSWPVEKMTKVGYRHFSELFFFWTGPMSLGKIRKVAQNCQSLEKLQKARKCYEKLRKVTTSCTRLRKVAQSFEKFCKVTKSFAKLQKVSQGYEKLRKVAISFAMLRKVMQCLVQPWVTLRNFSKLWQFCATLRIFPSDTGPENWKKKKNR